MGSSWFNNKNKFVYKNSSKLLNVFVLIIACLPLVFIENTKAAQILELTPSQDAFVSSSTSSGNRRMLFVGKYTDNTICSPTEGCPPIYQNSSSVLKFDLRLPSNTLPTSATLKLYHYGSNADLNLTVSRITSPWNEAVAFPGPTFEGNYGTAVIANFHTQDPGLIREETINISPTLISQLLSNNNGLIIRPTNNLNDPGAVFCSKESDSFCLPKYNPKLIISYIQNNAPNTPVLQSPENLAIISGNCDSSIDPPTGTCSDQITTTFNLNGIGDNDPSPGDLEKSYIDFFQNGTMVMTSEPIIGAGSVSWTGAFTDGVYQWKSRSIDKAGIFGQYSEERAVTFDSSPPETPFTNNLSSSIDITSGQISISAGKSTDNLSPEASISYSMQSSTDPLFSTILNSINGQEWQLENPVFNVQSSILIPGESYYFRIKSRDSANNTSSWSNVVSTTITDATTLQIPIIDKTGWDANDGVLADGLKPEKSRLTPFHVIKSKSLTITGKSEKEHKVEIFVNDKSVGIFEPKCDDSTSNSCNFSYTFTFPDKGENNISGVPVNSYTFQVRAINVNGKTSPFSAKVVIYHDAIAPRIPDVNLTANNTSLITNPLTKENKFILDTKTERFSDIKYSLIDPTGKVKESRLWKTPINGSSRLLSNINFDGTYIINIQSIDAAGNASQVKTLKFTRDTTPPAKPIVEPFICGNNICLKISGEPGTQIFANSVNKGFLSSQQQVLNEVENWNYGNEYKFTVQLKDTAQNLSEVTIKTILTPEIVRGLGDLNGSSKTSPYNYSYEVYRDINEKKSPTSFELTINRNTQEYTFTNYRVPNPVLTYTFSTFDNKVEIYGIDIPKHFTLSGHIYVDNSTYNEARKLCSIGFYLSTNDAKCIENKMGIPSLSAWRTNNQKVCGWKAFLVETNCLREKEQEWRVKEDKGIKTIDVQNVMVSIFKENGQFIDSFWNDNPDWKFKFITPLSDKLRVGDMVKAKTSLFGEFDVEGVTINYSGENKEDARRNTGLQSIFSNTISIDKPEYQNLNGQAAKILNVPYFNQSLEPTPVTYPDGGWKMCGAASVVMSAGYFDKLDYKDDDHSLKKYMYDDIFHGIKQNCSDYNTTTKKSSLYTGAFAVTSQSTCNYSYVSGMTSYLQNNMGLKTKMLGNNLSDINIIKKSIDRGNPVIFAYGDSSDSDFGHIALIVGYTDDKILVNDTYTNTERFGRGWRGYYDGKLAEYSLISKKFPRTYFIEVSNI